MDFAGQEVDRALRKGKTRYYRTWEDPGAALGEVVVAKLGAVIKSRPDGSLKVRLVADLRRNGYSEDVRLLERIRLSASGTWSRTPRRWAGPKAARRRACTSGSRTLWTPSTSLGGPGGEALPGGRASKRGLRQLRHGDLRRSGLPIGMGGAAALT